jgi:hypothetical protein
VVSAVGYVPRVTLYLVQWRHGSDWYVMLDSYRSLKAARSALAAWRRGLLDESIVTRVIRVTTMYELAG